MKQGAVIGSEIFDPLVGRIDQWWIKPVCENWPPIAPPKPRSSLRMKSMPGLDTLAQAIEGIRRASEFQDAQVYSALLQFARELSAQSHAVEAWRLTDGDLTSVWVFIDDESTETRRKVFDAEQRTMERFPSRKFDFFIFSLECREAFVSEQGKAEQFYVRS